MKTNKIVFINFFLILALILVIREIFVHVPRHYESELSTLSNEVQQLIEPFNKPRLAIRYKGLQTHASKDYSKLLPEEISKILGGSRFILTNETQSEQANFLVEIECVKPLTGEKSQLTLNSLESLHLELECKAEGQSAVQHITKHAREVRMLLNDLAMFSLAEEDLSNHHDNYFFEVSLINIDRNQTNVKFVEEVKKTFTSLAKKVNGALYNEQRIRINFNGGKGLMVGNEIKESIEGNDNNKVISVETMRKVGLMARRDSRIFNNWQNNQHIDVMVVISNEEISFGKDDKSYSFVELDENLYAIVLSSQNRKEPLNKGFTLDLMHLFDQIFNLNALTKELGKLNHLKVAEKNNKLLTFAFLRKHLFIGKLNNLKESLKQLDFALGDDEVSMEEPITSKILEKMKRMRDKLKDHHGDYYSIDEIDEFNALVGDTTFAVRDSFPTDYLIGIYLPLLAPVVVPLARTYIGMVRAKIKARKAAQTS